VADPTIKAKLTLDTKGYQQGVQAAQKSTGTFSRIRDTMAGVFGGNLMTAAAAKTKDFFVGAVKGAMDAEDANVRFKTSLQNIVGATDDQVAAANKFLASMSKTAAVSKGELRPAYETLLRGTHSLTGAQDALKTALDVSAGTGKPLASVAQAITKGFMGSTGGLQKMGIATKDASGHALSMTQIMQNLNKTFGGQAAKQAGTMSGQMKNAGLQFKAFQVSVGQALLPVLTQLVGVFMEFLPILQSMSGWVKNNQTVFKILAIAIVAVVAAVKGYQIAVAVWAAAQGIASAATAVWTGLQWALNASFMGFPLLLIIAGIAALVAAFVLAYQKVGWFRALVDATWQALQVAFHAIVAAGEWVISFFVGHWQILVAIIGGPIGVAVMLITRYWDQVKVAASVVVAFVRVVWQGLVIAFNLVAAYIRLYISTIIAVWNLLLATARVIVNALRAAWNGLVAAFSFVSGAVRGAISGLVSAFQIPLNAARTVVGGIKTAWNELVGFLGGIVSQVSGVIGRVAGAFKAPINAVISAWNGIGFSIPSIKLPDIGYGPIKIHGPTIGGQHFQLPHIRPLQSGGFIQSEGLAYLHAAEVVVPADQAAYGRGPVVHIENAHFGDAVDVDLFMARVAWQASRLAV
jgi:hypothetical protein